MPRALGLRSSRERSRVSSRRLRPWEPRSPRPGSSHLLATQSSGPRVSAVLCHQSPAQRARKQALSHVDSCSLEMYAQDVPNTFVQRLLYLHFYNRSALFCAKKTTRTTKQTTNHEMNKPKQQTRKQKNVGCAPYPIQPHKLRRQRGHSWLQAKISFAQTAGPHWKCQPQELLTDFAPGQDDEDQHKT